MALHVKFKARQQARINGADIEFAKASHLVFKNKAKVEKFNENGDLLESFVEAEEKEI